MSLGISSLALYMSLAKFTSPVKLVVSLMVVLALPVICG